MTPEEQAAMQWYGNLVLTEVLPCPVCGAGVAHFSQSALLTSSGTSSGARSDASPPVGEDDIERCHQLLLEVELAALVADPPKERADVGVEDHQADVGGVDLGRDIAFLLA